MVGSEEEMKHVSIALDKLELWFKTAKPGDIASHFELDPEQYWIYVYREEDAAPCWHLFHDVVSAQKYLDSSMETNMEKRCENCKYWAKVAGVQPYCIHYKHAGMYVPGFTSCPEHEPKEERSTPFDNLKFYLKDISTGELDIKYICEDCGKIEDKPFHWWTVLSIYHNGKASKRPGYHFRCEECDKKKEGKV